MENAVVQRAEAHSFRVPHLVSGWAKLAGVMVVGYLGMSRSFAYLGLPWFSLYIGEIALGVFLLFGPRTRRGRWLRVARKVRRLRRFEWILLLLLCYGGFEALRGILKGYPAFTAARDTAFDYYPLYLFLGVWVGLSERSALRHVVRALAWFNGCYGVAWVLFLSRVPWTIPGTSNAASIVHFFSGPYAASAVALLGLLAFEPKPGRVWYLILLNLSVLLGELVRAEWVGFTVGLILFAVLMKRFRQLFIAVGAGILLLAVMILLSVNLPAPKGRMGRVSAAYIVARAVSPVSKSLADDLAPKKEVADATGTAEWRLVWWFAIWEKINSNLPRAMLGLGYGYPIGTLNPYIAAGQFIQTPHNDFFYALAYCGWIGVGLFALLQFELARLLWRSYRATGLAFGIICWACLLAMSFFEDFFEAPFAAIPFFLLVGMAIAPALLARASSPRGTVGGRPSLAGN